MGRFNEARISDMKYHLSKGFLRIKDIKQAKHVYCLCITLIKRKSRKCINTFYRYFARVNTPEGFARGAGSGKYFKWREG